MQPGGLLFHYPGTSNHCWRRQDGFTHARECQTVQEGAHSTCTLLKHCVQNATKVQISGEFCAASDTQPPACIARSLARQGCHPRGIM
jgi:hypothetical protein